MFSSDELLHFVFANENDTYFCGDGLALDLDQYLWLLLHEQHYAAVYFLRLSDDELEVRTFGDRAAQSFDPSDGRRRLFGAQRARAEKLGKWMLRQLHARYSERAAFVCSLQDFCSYFGRPDREGILRELTAADRRTGILALTAPVEAESSAELLLHSPALEWMNEPGIAALRRGPLCGIYTALYRDKPDRCQFLNVYTEERLLQLLQRLYLEDAEKAADEQRTRGIAEYLLQVLQNPAFRRAEMKEGVRLPDGSAPFRKLFGLLKQDRVWRSVTAAEERCARAGGLEAYLTLRGITPADPQADTVGIRRDPRTGAGWLLSLNLPLSRGEPGEDAAESERLLAEIRHELREPRNRPENRALADAVRYLLPILSAALTGGDAASVRRVLYAIRFCVQWLWMPAGSGQEEGILKIVDMLLNRYVPCSQQLFAIGRSYALASRQADTGLAKLQKDKLAAEYAAVEKMMKTYEDAVRASVIGLSLGTSAAVVSAMAEDLRSILEKSEEEKALSPAPSGPAAQTRPVPEVPAPPEEDDENLYVLREEDWDYRPPT